MKLLSYLFQMGGRQVLVIAALGLAGGFAGTGFIVIINRILHDSGTTQRYILVAVFAGLAVARLTINLCSQWILVRFAQEKLLQLCDVLCRRVVQTPFRTLEQIGPARILSTLTDDVAILSAAIQAVPSLASNVAVLVGCLIYLAYLSWVASLVMLTLTACGAFCYKLLLKRAFKAIQAARAGRDTLFRHFRSLTEGAKEVKMSVDRQDLLIQREIGGTASYLRRQNLTATFDYMMAEGWSNAMFCLLMGLLLFGLPTLREITLPTLTGYAFVALYAMTPVWGLIGSMPTFQRGQAALERIETLGFSLSPGVQAPFESCPPQPSRTEKRPCVSSPAPCIELDGVSFSYQIEGNGQDGFILGPLSLILHPGQLIFIIGGNGSGKTTFVKLLAGLYAPDSGEIRVEGRPVSHDSQNYRELFSVVFSDFYLFDRLPGADMFDLDSRASTYLKLLQLDKKVRIADGAFSTTALSQGQRRRLALLTAYLEDRPVYVFDEWAADQDPAYKQVFYAHLLPELKSRGKIVVVITHDDRYFRFGDVVIKLDCGNIVDCWCPAERTERAAESPELSLRQETRDWAPR